MAPARLSSRWMYYAQVGPDPGRRTHGPGPRRLRPGPLVLALERSRQSAGVQSVRSQQQCQASQHIPDSVLTEYSDLLGELAAIDRPKLRDVHDAHTGHPGLSTAQPDVAGHVCESEVRRDRSHHHRRDRASIEAVLGLFAGAGEILR